MVLHYDEFYPTPKELVSKMIEGIDFRRVKSILEPSAGKGNIIEVLTNEVKTNHSLDIDCIEKERDLQHILKGKGYRVVYDDFLQYNTMKEYDIILMNPPFSNGAKHLLKAIEMQERNGGAIVCLLNAETLKNQCSNDRVALFNKLSEYQAQIEYMDNAFSDAERETDVEIVLVKVQLPEKEKISFILDGLRKTEEELEYEFNKSTDLVENDYFKAIVHQYQMEVEAGVRLIKEYYAMQSFIMSEFKKDEKTGETVQSGGCILSLDLALNRGSYNNILSVNGYIRQVRLKYWKALFDNPMFVGKLTRNLQSEFHNKVADLCEYDFSLYNIYELKCEMQSKVLSGIEETIIDLFDELGRKYSYYGETSGNIHYYNGWKTNKAWIINKKVIIPLDGWYGKGYSWYRFDPAQYDVINKLKDIEKCFNYLDGGLTESLDLEKALHEAKESETTKNIELKYFSITFYKKGTCHIVFKNDELLKKFNIFGSQHKGWLPPSYGKKVYDDMDAEEKEVIDGFEGEAAYSEVMNNTDYYIFDTRSVQLIEG